MKIVICIGSSCHVKGSRLVTEGIQRLVEEKKVGDKVELSGTFCMGQCQMGVCVSVDEEIFSVTPENVEEFFEKEVMGRL